MFLGKVSFNQLPWLAAAGGAGASVAGSLIAANEQSNAREQANSLAQQSIKDLMDIGVPSEEAMRVTLEKFRSAGQLTPELEQNILQGQSELKGIETDPRLADAQMNALDELRNLGQGGFNIQDKASLEKGLGQVRAQEKGQRDAILMDAAQRGATTGGGTLAAELLGASDASRGANQVGLDTAAQGYQRALDAIRGGGELATNMANTQFGQKAQVASAQDVINRMNTEAMQGTQTRNVGTKNAAQEYNLGNAQNIMNQNTGLTNQQEMYNKQLPAQTYQMQMQKAAQGANARAGQASNIVAGGQDAAKLAAGTGAGVAQIGAGVTNSIYKSDDEDKKLQALQSMRG